VHAPATSAPAIEFPWPIPPNASTAPIWTGDGFIVDGQSVPILSYSPGSSNWTDDLTHLHEAAAGDGQHPIDRASRAHAVDQIRANLPSPTASILEVGCSSGFLLNDLVNAFPQANIIGSDIVTGPLAALSKRCKVPLLHFDLVQCPLPDNCVDVAVQLNVLEHIEDHIGATRQLFRILKPGGIAVIEVPAGPHLFGLYDRVLMHWRRYHWRELCYMFESAGFETLYRSHLGFFLYHAFRRIKLRDARHFPGDPAVQRQRVEREIRETRTSRLVGAALRVECALAKFVRYPVGIRCLLTARKPLNAKP
jgi:SAM-dependent methyltransferase